MSPTRSEDLPGLLGHELRNPLASAVTAVSLLQELMDGDDPRRELVARTLSDLDRMTALTDSWLRLSRTGRMVKALIDVDDLLRTVAARHGVTVVSGPIDVAIDGDRALLERAIDNLVENAKQAGAVNVRIAAQSLGDDVSIHVEDDGAGIAEEHMYRIFDAGWSGRGGNGFGLHAVAATMRAHNGRVQCVRLHRGTRFTMHLPLSSLQPATA